MRNPHKATVTIRLNKCSMLTEYDSVARSHTKLHRFCAQYMMVDSVHLAIHPRHLIPLNADITNTIRVLRFRLRKHDLFKSFDNNTATPYCRWCVCVCVYSIIIVQGLIIEGLKCAAQKSDSTTEPQITMNMDAAMVNLNINTYL